jgi:hypothetical protein
LPEQDRGSPPKALKMDGGAVVSLQKKRMLPPRRKLVKFPSVTFAHAGKFLGIARINVLARLLGPLAEIGIRLPSKVEASLIFGLERSLGTLPRRILLAALEGGEDQVRLLRQMGRLTAQMQFPKRFE